MIEKYPAAAELVTDGAQPLSENVFKVDLARHSVVRALSPAAGNVENRPLIRPRAYRPPQPGPDEGGGQR